MPNFNEVWSCIQESSGEAVIQRDINRTFPAHDFFKESGGVGQESLFKISKVNTVSLYSQSSEIYQLMTVFLLSSIT